MVNQATFDEAVKRGVISPEEIKTVLSKNPNLVHLEGTADTSQEESPIVKGINTVYGFTEGMASELRSVMVGMAQMGAKLVPDSLGGKALDSFLHKAEGASRNMLSKAEKQSPIATGLGQVAGIVASGLAPIGAASAATKASGLIKGEGLVSGALRGAASGTTAGALGGLASYTPEGGSKLEQAGFGAALGGALGGTLGGIGSAVSGVKKALAGPGLDDLLSQIDPNDINKVKRSVERAQEAGVVITPGQASGNMALVRDEARIPLNTESRKKLYSALTTSSANLKKGFSDVLDKIVPEGEDALTKIKSTAYSDALPTDIPKDQAAKLLKNQHIKDAIGPAGNRKLSPSTADTIKQFPNHTQVGFFHSLKQYLYNKADSVGADRLAASDARILKLAAQEIDTTLKKVPAYQVASDAANRLHQRESLMAKLNSLEVKPGQSSPTLEQFYVAFAKSPEQRAELLKPLSKDARKSAVKLIHVLQDTVNSPLMSAVLKAPIERKASVGGTATYNALKSMQAFFQGKENGKMVDIIISGKYVDKIDEISKIKNTKTRMGALVHFLSQVGGVQSGSLLGTGSVEE